jgi:hypothetical protein
MASPSRSSESWPSRSSESSSEGSPEPKFMPRTVLIVVSILLVVCCGGAVVAGSYFATTVPKATDSARQAAEEFIVDLESGDSAAAYANLCARTQSQFSREDFVRRVTGQPKVRSHEIVSVDVVNANSVVVGSTLARLVLETGAVDRHTFALVKEHDVWKVCGQPY